MNIKKAHSPTIGSPKANPTLIGKTVSSKDLSTIAKDEKTGMFGPSKKKISEKILMKIDKLDYSKTSTEDLETLKDELSTIKDCFSDGMQKRSEKKVDRYNKINLNIQKAEQRIDREIELKKIQQCSDFPEVVTVLAKHHDADRLPKEYLARTINQLLPTNLQSRNENPKEFLTEVRQALIENNFDGKPTLQFFQDHFKENDFHTIIMMEQGPVALLNTLSDEEAKQANTTSGKKILGEGSFGKVRYGKNLKTNKLVAIKKIIGHDGTIKKAEKEAKIQTQFKGSKNVMEAEGYRHTYGKDDIDKMYIAMPLSEGGEDLYDTNIRINNTDKLDEPTKMNMKKFIALNTIKGLIEMHDKNTAHKDIKSENIMISENGEVKVIDFGLATDKSTNSTTREGTYNTASPFNRNYGKAETASQGDSYSLGITIAEIINPDVIPNLEPSDKFKFNSAQIRALRQTIKTLKNSDDDVLKELGQIIDELTMRDPTERTEISDLKGRISELEPQIISQEQFATLFQQA